MEHTGPLRELLLQMAHVIDGVAAVKSRAFDSGPQMRRPWIGFNLNGMDYFFWVSLNQPERVSLQRYAGLNGVAPDSFDGTLGEIEYRNGTARWSRTLDLAEPERRFFERDQSGQLAILREFFEQSFAFAQGLRAARPVADSSPMTPTHEDTLRLPGE
jgi:hypothetical protein